MQTTKKELEERDHRIRTLEWKVQEMDQLKAVANSADVAREIEEHTKAAEEKEVT